MRAAASRRFSLTVSAVSAYRISLPASSVRSSGVMSSAFITSYDLHATEAMPRPMSVYPEKSK